MKGEIIKAKTDDFLQNLQQMDPARLRALVQRATQNLSPAQQKKLKELINDQSKLEAFKNKISDKDIENLSKNIKDPKTLEQYMQQGDIQKRIDELL